MCLVAFAVGDQPPAIPTAYGRSGDEIFVHRSAASPGRGWLPGVRDSDVGRRSRAGALHVPPLDQLSFVRIFSADERLWSAELGDDAGTPASELAPWPKSGEAAESRTADLERVFRCGSHGRASDTNGSRAQTQRPSRTGPE